MFGYEIEFAGPSFVRDILRLHINEEWEVGTDLSANYRLWKGFEVRTPILEEFPVEGFRKLLAVMNATNCRIHARCGFHIHVSGFGSLSVQVVADKLKNKFSIWRERNDYCNGNYLGWNGFDPYSKYTPFRQVYEDHYEARFFNATTSLRGLHHYHKSLVSILRSQCEQH